MFTKLPTFTGSSFFGLDEMHLIGQGVARLFYGLVVTANLSPNNQKKNCFYKYPDNTYNKQQYTFLIPKQELINAGHCINISRCNIPVSFQGSWDNLINKIDGARAIDFIDFLLYVVPTLIVPLFARADVRKAVISLVRGCAMALQWEFTNSQIIEMEK